MDGLKSFATRKIKKIVALAALGIQALLGIIFVFVGLRKDQALDDSRALYNIFSSDYFTTLNDVQNVKELVFGSIVLAATLVLLILTAVGFYKTLTRRKMLFLEAGAAAMGFSMVLFGAISGLISVILPVLIMLVAGLLFGYLFFFYKTNKEEAKIEAERANDATISEGKEKEVNVRRGVLPAIITMFVGLVATFLVFVLPVCKFGDEVVFKLFDANNTGKITPMELKRVMDILIC